MAILLSHYSEPQSSEFMDNYAHPIYLPALQGLKVKTIYIQVPLQNTFALQNGLQKYQSIYEMNVFMIIEFLLEHKGPQDYLGNFCTLSE